jgi:hypothetical protein
MTAVIRAKKLERKPQRYVKVMGRLTDPKRRAKAVLENHGPDADPDYWNYYTGYPIEYYGFTGAFEAAEQFIADEVFKFGDTFEWKITGGEW